MQPRSDTMNEIMSTDMTNPHRMSKRYSFCRNMHMSARVYDSLTPFLAHINPSYLEHGLEEEN